MSGDNYPRLTNYIAATLNAGHGHLHRAVAVAHGPTTSAKATLDNFLQNMFQQGMIQDWKVVLDASNNIRSRASPSATCRPT